MNSPQNNSEASSQAEENLVEIPKEIYIYLNKTDSTLLIN